MTTLTISASNLDNATHFVEEVKEAFATSASPVCFEISNRDDVEAFARCFKPSQHAYRGKSISCKNAKGFAPSSYSAVEICAFNSDRYPISLFFKSIQEIEDFAEGYIRAVETASVPAAPSPIQETTPKPEAVSGSTTDTIWTKEANVLKRVLEEGQSHDVGFVELFDIKAFVSAVKQIFPIELKEDSILEQESQKPLFNVRWGLGFYRRVSFWEVIRDLPCTINVSFDTIENVCLFASLFEYASRKGIIKLNENDNEHKLNENEVNHITASVDIKQIQDKYFANQKAESVLDSVAQSILTLGWIIGVLNIILGFVIVSIADEVGIPLLIGCILFGIAWIVFGYICWATLKVVVNISNNLYGIREALNSKE